MPDHEEQTPGGNGGNQPTPHEAVVRVRCPSCGYVLDGLAEEGSCPECGTAYRKAELRARQAPLSRSEICLRTGWPVLVEAAMLVLGLMAIGAEALFMLCPALLGVLAMTITLLVNTPIQLRKAAERNLTETQRADGAFRTAWRLGPGPFVVFLGCIAGGVLPVLGFGACVIAASQF